VTAQLRRDGLDVNHNRILRLMREESLLRCANRRLVATTDPGLGQAVRRIVLDLLLW